MKTLLPRRIFGAFLFALCLLFQTAFAQQSVLATENLTSEKVVEKIAPSVVLILTGKGAGVTDKVASGVVVREDGVILTAYHTVKDATQVQIRLKSGEIYDKADLIGYDERRDVAALKIPASNLPVANISRDEAKIGEKVFVVSNPQSLKWSVADGLLSAVRMADEIPGAGQGFKVVQFSAPVSSGSSGGLLTDEKGQAVGLIVASLSAGQNLNFAIPFSSVSGLINSAQIVMSFGKGNGLELPQPVRPPSSIDITSADPKQILGNAKIFYVYSYSELISDKMMENALMKLPEFENRQLILVKDSKTPDVVINVEHDLFTFDYRYTMTDRRTDIVLATGKVTAWDGKIASAKFAKAIVAKLKQSKEASNNSPKTVKTDK